MKRKRKRSKMTRYNPDPVTALRAEMAKHPNPMFGQMLVQERMSDGDLLDFSVSVAISYFNGALLEPVAAAAGRELERMARQTLLVTASKFGATAIFTKDGGADLKSIFPDEGPDLLTFAIQQLVNTNMSVEQAMQELEPPAPVQCQIESDVSTQLPEIVEVVH